MLLTTILETSADLLPAVNALKDALKRHPKRGYGYDVTHEFTKEGATVEVRDWGNWQVPEGEEDDGDYDWEEMTPASMKDLSAIMDKLEKEFPMVDFSPQTGEKNWLYVYIKWKK